MAKCALFLPLLAVVIAALAGFMWDSRAADLKADSILFVKQTFDERVDLPAATATTNQPTRAFFVDTPDDSTNGKPSPILFLIHGKASNADDMKTLFGAQSVARARLEGFLVVYPVGILNADDSSRTWNAGSVDAHNTADDVAYFTRVVHHLARHFNADAQSVFLAGMSNGGFMVNRLACEWGTTTDDDGASSSSSSSSNNSGIRVRAIAPTLGGLAAMKYDETCGGKAVRMGGVPVPPIRVFDQAKCPYATWRQAPAHFACDGVRDLPVFMVNNGQDVLVPLGGAVITKGGGEMYPPVAYTLRFYAESNGCDYDDQDGAAARTRTLFERASGAVGGGEDVTACDSLKGCRANTTLCVSRQSGHNWVTPTNGEDPPMPSRFFRWLMSPYAKSFDTSAAILDFFSKHRM